MSTTRDLTKIERSVFIRAPRSRVWSAIANVEEFASWFQVKAEGEFKPGATVPMTCTVPGYEGIRFDVTIESVEPERRLAWRWIPGAEQPPDESTTFVEFVLADEDGGTRVTVTESGFDRISLVRRAKAYEENSKGWEAQMQNLERYVTNAG